VGGEKGGIVIRRPFFFRKTIETEETGQLCCMCSMRGRGSEMCHKNPMYGGKGVGVCVGGVGGSEWTHRSCQLREKTGDLRTVYLPREG